MIIETCPQCGGDLVNYIITTYPPIPGKKCMSCGWSWEGRGEEIKRVPFDPDRKEENKTTVEYHWVWSGNGPCPHFCWNKTDMGYCRSSVCINPVYNGVNSYNTASPCDACSNNPKNGGSGICHCILGSPKIT